MAVVAVHVVAVVVDRVFIISEVVAAANDILDDDFYAIGELAASLTHADGQGLWGSQCASALLHFALVNALHILTSLSEV